MLWQMVKILLLAVLGFIALTAVYAKSSNAWFIIPVAGVVGFWLYRRSTALPVVQFVAAPPSTRPCAVVTGPGAPLAPWTAVVDETRAELERRLVAGDWDTVRAALQKLAYGMTDATKEEKAAYTALVTQFAARDPLVSEVMEILRPAVEARPGMKQTETYALLPFIETEWVRYVLYYAAELGQIVRQKKGNTYTLWPAGHVFETPTVAKPLTARKRGKFTPEEITQHKAERKKHWAQRMPQMLAAAEVCPYWQFRVVGDAGDPPACRAVDGHLARFDSEFWQTHNPAKCRRQMCRCTIRAYSQRQFEAKGLVLSPPLAAKK